MTKKLRRVIFWSIVAIFIIITPIFLAYSFGYFFDLTEFKWVKTGSIYLDSEPPGAIIYINGKTTEKETPKLLKRLKPGQYLVSLVKDNFSSWQKTLSINSYQVTEARNVFLPLQNPIISLTNFKTLKDVFSNTRQKNKENLAANYLQSQKIPYASLQIRGNFFYFLKKPGLTLFKKALDLEAEAQQISFTNLDFCNCSTKDPEIILGPNKKIVLVTPEKELYFLSQDKEFKLIHQNVDQAGFSKDESKLFILSNNEIWIYFIAPTKYQPLHDRGDKIFLARLSTPIVSVSWYPDSEHILFSTKDQIKMIEIDERDSRNIFNLISVKQAQLYTDFSQDKVYFASENQVFSLDLEE